MNSRTLAAGLAALVLVVAAIYAAYRYGMGQGMQMGNPAPSAAEGRVDPNTGRRVLYWHDPMVPGQKFDKPGKSPFMDMQLVPVYADEADAEGTVSIDPRVAQNLGVRTAEVVRGALTPKIQAVGTIAYNERELVLVQAKIGGFVEKLHVRAPLDQVTKGEPLVEILAPDWVAVQEDYLALRRMSEPDTQLLGAARQRMRLVGMTEDSIRNVESTGKVLPRATLFAPESGVVAELGVREGMTVTAGAMLFRINSLASVWLNAEIPANEAAKLKPGQPAQAKSAAYPGAMFKGRISALLPQVNTTTRTIVARIELSNPERRLVPGMFVDVDLSSAGRREALLVPSEAVIQTGTRSVAVLALGDGKFQPVEVATGSEANGRTEIRRGLKAGQKVVVSGQFLIDSEASLKGVMARMEGTVGAEDNSQSGVVHFGDAKVVAVGEEETVLAHGPISSLKWPPMTMAFRNPRGGLPADIAVGDAVTFGFHQGEAGRFELTEIRRADSRGVGGARAKAGKP